MSFRRLLALSFAATLLVCAALPTATRAQDAGSSHDEEARALFEAGRVAYEDGRFQAALGYFRQSYELSGRPRLLYNIGSAADKLRRDRQAIEAFEAYLAQVPTADNRNEVAARLEVLRGLHTDTPTTAVATPREAASSSTGEDRATSTGAMQVGVGNGAGDATPRDDEAGGILSEWWFWTLIGAAVAGGVLIAVLATSGGDKNADLRTGTDGGVVLTLTMP